MTFVFIALCLVAASTLSLGDPKCGPNEVLNTCPSTHCPAQNCPKSENYDRSCLNSDSKNCPPSACDCRFNYKRAKNGTCIPTRSCPPFKCSGAFQEYNPCPPYCPTDDCSQATPDGNCPSIFGNILVVVECQPTCRCMKGYWKKNGVCVPYAECPNKG